VLVEPWVDPVIDTVGHDPRSAYVERFWLAVLGPSCAWVMRRLADRFDREPEGFELDLDELSAGLGLGGTAGQQSALVRALDRSRTFGVVRPVGPSAIAVRRRLPPLSRRQLQRLPKSVQAEHQSWVRNDARKPAAAEMRQRARALALSLLDLGETYDATERQLHRWKFHPALAHDAVKWATVEHQRRAAAT
jgi:hypothetical protein